MNKALFLYLQTVAECRVPGQALPQCWLQSEGKDRQLQGQGPIFLFSQPALLSLNPSHTRLKGLLLAGLHHRWALLDGQGMGDVALLSLDSRQPLDSNAFHISPAPTVKV